MNQRIRTALTLSGGLLLVLAAGVAAGQLLLLPAFARLERDQCRRELALAELALAAEARGLGRVAEDWASRDGIGGFFIDRDPGFVGKTVGAGVLERLGLEFILFFDSAGRFLDGRFRSLEAEPTPWGWKGLEGYLGEGREGVGGVVGKEGILTVPGEGPYLAAIRPVRARGSEPPPTGFIVLGRRVGPVLARELSERLRLDLALLPLRPVPPGEDGRALAHLAAGTEADLIPAGEGRIWAYGLVRDLEGNPGVLLRLRLDRSLFGSASRLLRVTYAALLAGVLLFGFAAYAFWNRHIFGPLARLAGAVSGAGEAGTGFSPIPAGEDDEIGTLARSLNQSFERLEGALEQGRRERERLAVTLDSVADGVLTVDSGGAILLLNPKAEEVTGWGREEATGRSLSEVLRVEDGEGGEIGLEELLHQASPSAPAGPLSAVRRDGDRRQVSLRIQPVRVEEGRKVGAVVVVRDGVGDRRAEKEHADLQRAQVLFLLLRGGVQEIAALLGAQRGHLEGLRPREGEADAPESRAFAEIQGAMGQAQALLRHLSFLVSSPAGPPRNWDPAGLLHRASEAALRGTSVVGALRIPPGLPPLQGEEGPLLFLLEAVLGFLARGQQKRGRLQVTAQAAQLDSFNSLTLPPGPYLEVIAEDEGPPLSSDELRSVFEPGVGSKRGEAGRRLALAHALAKQLGGRMTLEGREGRNVATLLLPGRVH